MLYVFVSVVYVCLLVCMFVSMCVLVDFYVCIWKPKVNVECLPWLLSTSLRQSTVSASWVIAGGSHIWLLCGFRDPNTSPQMYTANTFSIEQLHSLRVRFSSHQANGLWRSSLTHLVVWLRTPDLKQVTMACSCVSLTQSGNASSSDFVLGYASWSNKPTGWHCCQATLTHGISEDV